MADSAFDYVATIASINASNSTVTWQFVTDPADSAKPVYTVRQGLASSQFNDSALENLAASLAPQAASHWNRQALVESDNPGFDPADFVGDSYRGRYRIAEYPAPPTLTNPLTQKYESLTTTDSNTISYGTQIVAQDSAEKASTLSNLSIKKDALYDKLYADGIYEQVMVTVCREPMHATWDASAGAGYTWSGDKINSFGIDSVSRSGTGLFRIHFARALNDANFSVSTAVGAEDYSGAGASPRQVTVLSNNFDGVRDSHLDICVERTDDAVNEDNSYISVTITPSTLVDSAYRELKSKQEFLFGGPALTKIQTIKGLSDSDFGAWMNGSPGSY